MKYPEQSAARNINIPQAPTHTFSISRCIENMGRVILFGAGGAGRDALQFLSKKNIEVLFFCDNDPNKFNTLFKGVPVRSPEHLADYQDEIILISSDYAVEIGRQLRSLGINRFYYFGYCFDYSRWSNHFEPDSIIDYSSAIEQTASIFHDELSREAFLSLVRFRLTSDPLYLQCSSFEQYFHPQVRPEGGDTIIDAGAWNGDTAIQFAGLCRKHGHIYSMEPDTSNFKKLTDNIHQHGLTATVSPVQLGLWSDTCTLSFNCSCDNSMQYRIDGTGTGQIPVTTLDDFVRERNLSRVDLIKMDIEGAEQEAIRGSESVIRTWRPRLQISVYHKHDDLWEIPLALYKMNPEYRFYLGIHKQNFIDTILYAIDSKNK